MKKSVKLNAVMNTIKITSNLIFPLITFPYTSRILGPSGTGSVNFALSFVAYFSLIAGLGIPLYGMREVARCRDHSDKLSRLVQELLLIHSISTAFISIAYVISVLLIPKLQHDVFLFLLVGATIPLSMLTMEWYYQGLEEYSYITIRSIAFSTLSIAALFIFIHNPSDYIVSATITIFSSLGSSVLNFWNARKTIFRKSTERLNLTQHIKPLLTLFLLNFILSIYLNLDTVMLGFLSSTKNVGYYASGLKLTKTLLGVVGAFGVVMIPRLSYYVSMKMHDEFQKMLKKSLSATLFLCLPVTVGLILLNRPLLLLMAGKTYLPASDCVVLTAPIILCIGLTQIFGMQILYPLGKERLVIATVTVGALVSFGLNLFLIPKFAHVGAAWSTLCAEFTVLMIQFFIVRRYFTFDISIATIMKPFVSTAVMGVAIFWMQRLEIISNLFASLIILSIIGFAFFSFSSYILKDENFTLVLSIIRKRLHPKAAHA